MFVCLLAVLITSASLLCGCADKNPAAQTDSKSMIQEPKSDHEIHGEIGAMYGASASRH